MDSPSSAIIESTNDSSSSSIAGKGPENMWSSSIRRNKSARPSQPCFSRNSCRRQTILLHGISSVLVLTILRVDVVQHHPTLRCNIRPLLCHYCCCESKHILRPRICDVVVVRKRKLSPSHLDSVVSCRTTKKPGSLASACLFSLSHWYSDESRCGTRTSLLACIFVLVLQLKR